MPAKNWKKSRKENGKDKAKKEIPVMKTTEVVAALIWKQNSFLICQRPAHKTRGLLWEFVGGKVEPGETGPRALVRECREELGVTVEAGSLFMEVLHTYPDMTVHLRLYNAVIKEGTLQKLEHNDIRWITTEQMEDYDFCPADVAILERLKEVGPYYPLYLQLERFAEERRFTQTLQALPYAEQMHRGQYRAGRKAPGKPYLHHPLTVAWHAVMLGYEEDELVAAAILHDVSEDCGVAPEELPVNETVRRIVAALTKTYPKSLSPEEKERALVQYFEVLSRNRQASVIKLLDRCNNISEMAEGFSTGRMGSYVRETERLVLPLFDSLSLSGLTAEDNARLWLIRYHMESVLNNSKALLEKR